MACRPLRFIEYGQERPGIVSSPRRHDMVAVAHTPEFLYSQEERRRAIRREISALPLLEGFVIRHISGIGCDSMSRRQLAGQMHMSIEDIAMAEISAMDKLRRVLRYLL